MSVPSHEITSTIMAAMGGDPTALQQLVQKAAANQKTLAETQVTHFGNKIVLPALPQPMPIDQAMAILAARAKAAEQEYDIYESMDGYPFDCAAAFTRALNKRYGFVNSVTVQHETFFGKVDVRPDMRQIRTGPNPEDIIQVPTGGFQLPGFDKPIETGFRQDRKTGKVSFIVTGTLKAKDRDAIREILADAVTELREHSIYRNRAILLKTNDNGEVEAGNEPEFIATDKIDAAQLILSRDVEALLQDTLLTLIQKTAQCRALNIPLKRTEMLAGPYGTGKTLCAYVTAKHCVDSGEWTYVMVDRVEGLPDALRFARRYQPCVVFAEDIDRAMEERDDAANDLLNEIDGLLSKDSEIITVLTTNHLERIQKAMLRPGRTDAIIMVNAPDAEAAERLVRLFAGDLIGPDEDLSQVGEAIEGHIPAVIREIVERAKLGMVTRNDTRLSCRDLLVAAHGMKLHAALISDSIPEEQHNDYEKLGRAFGAVIANGPMAKVHEKLDEIIESF